jgi:hypothetical protein
LCVAGSETNPASPGALELNTGIAFNVCVKQLAPALNPASPSSYVAVEWPMDTFIPCAVNVLIREAESGSSGARVTSLTTSLRLEVPYMDDGDVLQGWKRESLWAPFLVG